MHLSSVHHCELLEKSEDLLLKPAPYAPAIIKRCYRLFHFFTISESYESQQYFRSNASILKEKIRHLGNRQYRFTIHPFSKFAKIERIVMSLLWAFLFYVTPFFGSFQAVSLFVNRDYTKNIGYMIVMVVVNSLLVSDIIIRFFLGYTIEQTREIVLDSRRIVKHYMKTYFVFDLTPVIITTCLPIISKVVDYRIKLIVFQITAVRLCRIKTTTDGLDMILQMLQVRETIRSFFIIYFCMLVSVHWWTCFLKLVNVMRDAYKIPYNSSWIAKLHSEEQKKRIVNLQNSDGLAQSRVKEYVNYMSTVLCHFLGAGFGRHETDDPLEMLLFSFLLLFGMAFYLCALGIFLEKLGIIDVSGSKFEQVVAQAQEFMTTKRYPSRLRRRIYEYYNYRFDKKFFSERKILNSLSEHLQMEILLYSCENLMHKVQIFKGLSKAAAGCILALLKQEIYLPNDTIMSGDDGSGTLYFILFGTCAVLLTSGKEVMHIEDGNHFGSNRDFARNVPQDFMYKIVALEPCEVYSLSKEDIAYCCRQYPEIATKMEIMCGSRARQYNNAFARAEADEESVSASDIVADLRRGNILERGIIRVEPLTPFHEQ
ncbi:cNMP binding domain containing protein [Asbolus verrucosus]|uniref:cNMP binding domain containing protein n=1 Tax=Asbolus verrucosus TaxID=1661398 RepID=A0A482VE03_ASBVE|nr:cNMP binding domain containing protein [Asbolus verrucosus]